MEKCLGSKYDDLSSTPQPHMPARYIIQPVTLALGRQRPEYPWGGACCPVNLAESAGDSVSKIR